MPITIPNKLVGNTVLSPTGESSYEIEYGTGTPVLINSKWSKPNANLESCVPFTAPATVAGAYNAGDLCVLMSRGGTSLLNLTTGVMTQNAFGPISNGDYEILFTAPATVAGAYNAGDLCVLIVGIGALESFLINLTTGVKVIFISMTTRPATGAATLFTAPATVAGLYNAGDLCVLLATQLNSGSAVLWAVKNLSTGGLVEDVYNSGIVSSTVKHTLINDPATGHLCVFASVLQVVFLIDLVDKSITNLFNTSGASSVSDIVPFIAPAAVTGVSAGALCALIINESSNVLDLYNFNTKSIFKQWMTKGNAFQYSKGIPFTAPATVAGAYNAGDLCVLIVNRTNGLTDCINLTRKTAALNWAAFGGSTYRGFNMFIMPNTGELCVVSFSNNFAGLLNLTTGVMTQTWPCTLISNRVTALFTAPATVAGAYNAGDLCVLMSDNLNIGVLNLGQCTKLKINNTDYVDYISGARRTDVQCTNDLLNQNICVNRFYKTSMLI